MQVLFTQENICAIVMETMMVRYNVGDTEFEDSEEFFNDSEGHFTMEVSEWLKDNSELLDNDMYWIESSYRRGNTYNGIVAEGAIQIVAFRLKQGNLLLISELCFQNRAIAT